jgi:hypothetical protein
MCTQGGAYGMCSGMCWQFGTDLPTFGRNTLGHIPEEINSQVTITFPEHQQTRHSSSISCLCVHFLISASSPDYTALNNDKYSEQRTGKLENYPGNSPEGTKKIQEKFQNSKSLGRDLNPKTKLN